MQTHPNPIQRNVRGKFPTTYHEAEMIWSSSKSPTGRIASNTYLNADGDVLTVTLYETGILRFYPDGRIRLNSGGYQTATTRDRFRQLGVTVYTCQGVAHVAHGGRSWTFSDGMMLNPDGTVSYLQATDPDPERVQRRRMRNRRRGDYVPCDGRQSSRWSGGNVPEAFDEGELRHCHRCRGNGYTGGFGGAGREAARSCPECNGNGLIEKICMVGTVEWSDFANRYYTKGSAR